MAANTTIRLKRSSVAGKTPTTSTLSTGELALNLTDKKLYSSDGSAIFEPAGNVSTLYVGDASVKTVINSTSITSNYGLTVEQNTAGQSLTLKNNGHETIFLSNGNIRAPGALVGSTYDSNIVDVSGSSVQVKSGLSNVQIAASTDRVTYKNWTFGTDGLTTLPGGISANGSNGTSGQVLTSSGSGNVYWSSVTGGGSLDVNAQYTWTNTQTFTNTITFNSTINGTANAANYIGSLPAANVVSNSQLQSNLANYTNTAGLPTVINNNTANDVFYVNGVTAVNVVSNAQLTANLANYTNTASLYLDTLQDVSAGGPTDGQILTWNSSTNQWNPQAAPTVVTGVTPGYYGSFYDANANQTISSISSSYIVRVANTYEQNGVTVVNNTQITFAYSGTYEITYSIQLENSGNFQEDVNFWFNKNNSQVALSDSKFTVNGKSGGSGAPPGTLIAVTPFIATVNAGDYFEIAWKASNTSVQIVSYAAGASPTTPVIPGVIITVKQVANIISAPPGTNSQIIFNDSGVSNATAGFTFNKTTNNVTVGNNLFVTGYVNAAALDVDGYFVANSTFVYANNGIRLAPKAGSTTISTEGSLFYDSLNHALNVYTDGATPQELGQQIFVRVYNNTGSSISKGSVVYINGSNANRPTIDKAIANNGAATARAIGVVFDDISTGNEGFVLTRGLLQNVDTRNYTSGQKLWLSAATAGLISNTDPSYPNYSVELGYALNSALSGSIYVEAPIVNFTTPNTSVAVSNGTTYISSDNFTFDYANNVLQVGNSTTNATIGYFNTSGTTTFMNLSGIADASLDSVIANYSTGTNASSDFAAYDSNGPASGNFVDMGINGPNWSQSFWTINGPSDGYVYTGNSNLSVGTAGAFALNFFTGGTLAANERMRITPTGNVGIGNTAPGNKLSVGGTSYLGGDVTITGNLIVSGTTVTVNAATLDVKDLNITVAKGAVSAIAADGAGLTVDTAGIGWYYNNGSNTWQSNVGITPSANITFDLGTTGLRWSNVYANNIVSANVYGTIRTSSQPYVSANNSDYLGGQAAASYQLNSTLAANVATLTANAATYLNGKTEGNLNVNNALTSNNSSYLGGTAASGYQTTAGLAANVAKLDANNAGYLGGVVYSNYVNTSANYTITGVHTINANIAVNGAFFAAGSNGQVGQVLTSNGTSNVYWSTVLTSIPASYVQNTDSRVLSGNLNFTGTNTYFSAPTTFAANVKIATTSGINANGSYGTSGDVLTSNGTAVYWSTVSSASNSVRQQFTGDGLTTIYSISGGYTPSQIDVYLNGVKQRNGTDVTVTSGTDVVFATAPYLNSLIDIVGITATAVVTSTTSSTASIAINNVNFTSTANGLSYTVGYFSSTGDASAKTYLLFGLSTSGTEIEIFSDTTKRIPIRANTTIYYTADIVARGIDTGSGEYAAFNLRGIASANSSNNGFDQGTLMETIVGRSNSNYNVDARANTSTGSLNIYVTGKASTNIRWVAEVKTVEVSQ